jgi:hypothetical protein
VAGNYYPNLSPLENEPPMKALFLGTLAASQAMPINEFITAEYIRAAGARAHAEGFGDREVLACGYIYVLRQLSLSMTDRDLAIAVATGIVARGMP